MPCVSKSVSHPGSAPVPGHLCVHSWVSFLVGHPRSSVALWWGWRFSLVLAGAWVQAVVGNESTSCEVSVCPLGSAWGTWVHTLLTVESRLPTAFVLAPVVLQPAKRPHLPLLDPRREVPSHLPFPLSALPWPDCFSSLLTGFRVDFSHRLDYRRVVLLGYSSFSVTIVPHCRFYLICPCEAVSSPSSYSAVLIGPHYFAGPLFLHLSNGETGLSSFLTHDWVIWTWMGLNERGNETENRCLDKLGEVRK